MTRFSAALVGVLLAYSEPVSADPSPVVELRIAIDGSVYVEGRRFTDVSALKAKLSEAAHRHPPAKTELHIAKDAPFEKVGHGLLLLMQSGWVGKVGYLTEPRN